MEYRLSIAGGIEGEKKLFGPQLPEVVMDAERGRRVAKATARVKKTICSAEVNDMGTGVYLVNGEHYDEFRSLQARYS
uniref:Transposase n=1 Tax=Steinernema glaseri TaxID=37863 RepID=A0A1I7ZWM3_9BILA